MSINTQSIQFRLISLLSLGAILLGGTTLYGFTSLSQILAIYDDALNQQVAHERQILTIENDFKKQVQEWKDVLLRGHEQSNYDKYWGKFLAKERAIREHGQALRQRLPAGKARRLLQEFLKSHQAMGEAYRRGLEEFKAADFDPRVGDRAVKGIDRGPTRALDQAAEAISLAVRQATADLKQRGAHTMEVTAIISLLTLLGIVVVSVWMVRRIVLLPTRDISECLNRFSEGDFTRRELATHEGELGEVLMNAQRVREHLGRIIHEVRGSSSDLLEASGELTSITGTTKSDLDQQQADIRQVATAMDQMAAGVAQVSANAEAAAEAAKKADQATVAGREMVDKTIGAIGGLARDVEGAATVIQTLESDVANIATVLDVIRGIAEQTNLLALNAAIEAARAGEQGRGFAVVADEVRTLAGRTQDSTSEIQAMIEKLENGTSEAVRVMGEGRHQAEATVEQAAITAQSFTTIAEAVVAIAEMNQQIAVNSTEQSAVTEEIHRNVARINELAQHTGQGAESLALSGGRIAQLANDLEKLVSQFNI